ncbi:MAG TPA: formyltetrahydrofolate deformylase [Treponemataceae bacterium]|jgi:formyltetrahydrofolate deformylase|nr:formyltetrahydrofolate deformylase [Treponemataceae bacterium]
MKLLIEGIFMQKYTLTVSCPDKSGLIASITNDIASANGNIINLAQHTAVDIDTFFCKVDFTPVNGFDLAVFKAQFESSAQKYAMKWRLYDWNKKSRMAVLVSKTSHCLYEVLLKHQDGQLNCDIPLVISNHPDLSHIATDFHIPFFKVDPEKGKAAYEADMQKLLEEYDIDVICLARYMQILSPEFTRAWEHRIINIHHGFLPAFKGAKPYHQAWQKGVKIIGATAHFANEDLDQGPIIYQDIVRVNDTKSIEEFVLVGKDVERKVLVEGLKRYFNHNIFLAGNRTFILE